MTCALGWAAAAPHEAAAADGTWNLYYLDENASLKQMPGEFTALGRTTSSFVVQGAACAIDADGSGWAPNSGSPYRPSADAQCVANTETEAHDDSDAIPMHSDIWGTMTIRRHERDVRSYWLNLSVDESGRLWVIPDSTSDDNTSAPTWAYRDIEFSAGTAGSSPFKDDEKPVLLLGRPRAQAAGTVINQSPTAGAPVSDLTIPALAVGGGLAALGFGLSRRRRA
ncbi:hypothetical protein [Bifidobacterium myosotis]|uniref:Uncharacterized protein n=1 Tax=Bifidobacterium myosotis TaxID=1630166 RepID=A0A5M9ZLA5_9BIFI|nr:hypothetical protein [Bifidobacterium myosotis]KAA8828103.1 hypothetical protein EMO91_06595 [Bifidobacterium myosotis]